MKQGLRTYVSSIGFSIVLASLSFGALAAGPDVAPPGRTIGYAMTAIKWATYETPGAKDECPNGLAKVGPREQFKEMFPADGTKRTLIETQLRQTAELWWPDVAPERLMIPEAAGKIAYGIDLDGKNKPSDFTSPSGKTGIDNQLYRAIGCIPNYRTGASVLEFQKIFFSKNLVNRILIELTDVDSLVNDDDVTVTTYRGNDALMSGATGNDFIAGGTQQLDLRWGKEFIHKAKGKIVNGTLITDALEFLVPMELPHQDGAVFWLRDARFELSLTPQLAHGVIGGYADIDTIYRARNRQWSPHHLSYGQESSAAVYQSMKRLADAYPDPVTGKNTAISSAFDVNFVQVHVVRDGDLTATIPASTRAALNTH